MFQNYKILTHSAQIKVQGRGERPSYCPYQRKGGSINTHLIKNQGLYTSTYICTQILLLGHTCEFWGSAWVQPATGLARVASPTQHNHPNSLSGESCGSSGWSATRTWRAERHHAQLRNTAAFLHPVGWLLSLEKSHRKSGCLSTLPAELLSFFILHPYRASVVKSKCINKEQLFRLLYLSC